MFLCGVLSVLQGSLRSMSFLVLFFFFFLIFFLVLKYVFLFYYLVWTKLIEFAANYLSDWCVVIFPVKAISSALVHFVKLMQGIHL